MLSWIGNALSSAASWIGDGITSLLSWLLSGVLSVLSKVIQALGGIFDVLNALWGFFVGLKDSILNLFLAFFPWVPEKVFIVISLGLFAVLLAGIVKKVRGK